MIIIGFSLKMDLKKPERQSSKLLLTNKLFGSVHEVYFLGEFGFINFFFSISNLMTGLATVLGGQVVIWHVGLSSGFYDFLVATIMIGMAYGCLTLCVAELTSVLPFSGEIQSLFQ